MNINIKYMQNEQFRCDVCGRYIPQSDFNSGVALRYMTQPDSYYTVEEYETLCKEHSNIKT